MYTHQIIHVCIDCQGLALHFSAFDIHATHVFQVYHVKCVADLYHIN